MKNRIFIIISIAFLLFFSLACNLFADLLPTPTKISGGNVGGQDLPPATHISTEQTIEPMQPPGTSTVIESTITSENGTPSTLVEQLRPCTLITTAEAEQILGEPVTAPQEINGACAFNNAKDSLYVISVSAAQEEETVNILQGQAMLLGMAGVPLDQAKLDQLKALAENQDYLAYFTELENLSKEVPSITALIQKGIPDLEFWIWLKADPRRQGSLVFVRNHTVLNLNLVVADSFSEITTLESLQDLAEKVFQRLPQQFSILEAPTATPTEIVAVSPVITSTPIPWEPTFTPTFVVSGPTNVPEYIEQLTYTGDCKMRPANSVCLRYEDGYIWLILNDSITGWDKTGTWQGRSVQVAYGLAADYYHVLGTNLVMVVGK